MERVSRRSIEGAETKMHNLGDVFEVVLMVSMGDCLSRRILLVSLRTTILYIIFYH